MALPVTDATYLAERGTQHSVTTEGGTVCVVLPAVPLPEGYDRPHSDLLLRLSPGYPDVHPDMWWFDPPVKLATGAFPAATEVRESYLGRAAQLRESKGKLSATAASRCWAAARCGCIRPRSF